jgi:hypothetical protein
VIIQIDAGGLPRALDRQFEVDSTICVHFTRILTALQYCLDSWLHSTKIGADVPPVGIAPTVWETAGALCAQRAKSTSAEHR